MTRNEFEAAYRKLMGAHGTQTANAGCIACDRCTGAVDSTFCVECSQIRAV